MSRLCITLLGAFRVTLDGEHQTSFGTDKARALLAYLAVEGHRPHRREHLAGLLWSDQAEKKALHSLRQSLSSLRKLLQDQDLDSPYLIADRDIIQFNPESDYWLDTAEFKAALAQGVPQNQHSQAQQRPNIRRLQYALSLYRGNFLDQLILKGSPLFDEWAILQREMLTRQVIEAMCILIDYHERRNEFEQACKIAERIVGLIPWEENAHRVVMRMLAQAGQWSAAEFQYQSIQRYLKEELSVEPAEETSDLLEEIRQSASQNQPLGPRYSCYPHNLPLEDTPFVGRDDELTYLSDLLATPKSRLITLSGPGGIGKSRLALQVARDQAGLFSDGVFFVPLTSVTNTDLLPISIAEAIGFSFYSSQAPMQLLLDHLRQKSMLLVLDNFEHLLADASQTPDLLTQILNRSPGISILVTSRQPLNLRSEQIIEVEGLAYPAPDGEPITDPSAKISNYSALELFKQVATRLNPRFSPEADQTAIVKICQLVEGFPLGIELSATWTRGYALPEIVAQIERNLDFLATPMRDVPDRHRSMRSVFTHSWQMLSEAEKSIYQKLSVFQGSFSREAAEAITGASAAQIVSLAEQSLLRRTAENRYDMHNLLRQFASEKLAQDSPVYQTSHNAHCLYFANHVREQEPALHGQNPVQAQKILSLDIENIRESWRWATENRNLDAICQMAGGLGRYYNMHSWFTEGRDAFTNAARNLQELSDPDDAFFQALVTVTTQLAWFEVQLGNYQEAVNLLEDIIPAVRTRNDQRNLSPVLNTLGSAVYELGEFDIAKGYFNESLREATKIENRSDMAFAANYLGNIARVQGEFNTAKQHFEESLAEYQRLGDQWGSDKVLNNLGNMAGISGNFVEAKRIFQESLSIRRTLEDQAGIAGCLHNLSIVAYIEQDFQLTKQLRLECLAICKEIGFTWGITSTLKHLGDVEKAMGHLSEAKEHYLESLEFSKDSGDRKSTAFTQSSLGDLAVRQGDFRNARHYFFKALKTANELELSPLIIDILIRIAELQMLEELYEAAYALITDTLDQPEIEKQTQVEGNKIKEQIEVHLSPNIIQETGLRQQPKPLEDIVSEIIETYLTRP